MRKLLLSIAIMILLSGCLTVPIPSSDGKRVPADRVFGFQEDKPETSSIIIVTRDTGFTGSACFIAITINGKLGAVLDVGETIQFFVVPGEVVLRVSGSPYAKGLCVRENIGTVRESILRSGETKYFRMTLNEAGFDIQRAEK